MNKRLKILSKYILVIFSVVFITSCKNEEAIPKKPNIVLILADDLGFGDLSCYGQKNFSTPNIDRLAEDGVKFTNHYAGSPVCAPARYTLLSGKHTGHGFIRGNAQDENGIGQLPLPPEEKLFSEYLKSVGYKTGIFGKWGLGNCDTEGSPLKHGFDEFFGYTDQVLAHNSYPEYLIKNCEKIYLKNKVKYLDSTAWHKGLGSITTEKIEYSNDLIFNEALKFIDANREQPFFLYFPTTIPHMNDEAEKGKRFEIADNLKFTNRKWTEEEKSYAASVELLDSYVGRLEDKLKVLNLLRNTLIVFTSDNGAVSGNRNHFSNGKLRGYKRDLYEGGIRVPFIAKWDGVIKPNTISNHISAFWDYFPTLLDIAGANNYPTTDGISFLPSMNGKGIQEKHEYLYWEFHWWKPTLRAIRKDNWKAVKMNLNSEVELYDLSNDISEVNNVVNEHPQIVSEMKKILLEARIHNELWEVK